MLGSVPEDDMPNKTPNKLPIKKTIAVMKLITINTTLSEDFIFSLSLSSRP